MRILRNSFITLCLITGAANPAFAHTDIDINLSFNPDLVAIPGYPVYYAPRVDMNYFFYDGMYWLYQDDDWYVSDWYNGPWDYVDRDDVPLFILRIPVRYYRRPPVYFHEWRGDEPPRWGWRWGNEWERHHDGWDHWDRDRAPSRAPLPMYQRGYSGDRDSDRNEHRDNRDHNYDSRHDNEARDYEHRDNRGDHPPQLQHPSGERAGPPQQNRDDRNSRSDTGRNEGQRTIQPRIPYPQRMPAPQEYPRENNPPRNQPPAQQHHEQEQHHDNSGNDRDHGNGQDHGGGKEWKRQ